MGPLRTGFVYGLIAVCLTLAAGFRFAYLDPASTPEWVLASAETFLPLLAAAAQIFLGILAAIRVRPVNADPEVPYRAILVRDCTLAAVVVAVMVGVTLLLMTTLHATIFANDLRDYANDVAPRIAAYVNETGQELRDPPPTTSAAQIERNLQPPVLRDLGRSIFNLVLRATLIGALGAVVGLIRGLSHRGLPRGAGPATPGAGKPREG
ncbi:MAG TPA: hypothetical protein VHM16_07775 [Rubrobacteraceae bacterium]|nr:hypothetical protein [Rubrobacteraceae bacterium]